MEGNNSSGRRWINERAESFLALSRIEIRVLWRYDILWWRLYFLSDNKRPKICVLWTYEIRIRIRYFTVQAVSMCLRSEFPDFRILLNFIYYSFLQRHNQNARETNICNRRVTYRRRNNLSLQRNKKALINLCTRPQCVPQGCLSKCILQHIPEQFQGCPLSIDSLASTPLDLVSMISLTNLIIILLFFSKTALHPSSTASREEISPSFEATGFGDIYACSRS